MGQYNKRRVILTATTESRAATAKMSAQETTGRPQILSTSFLIRSITSNPLAELLFAREFFSLSMVDVESRRSEASQPCITKTNNLFIRIHAHQNQDRLTTTASKLETFIYNRIKVLR